MVKKLLPLFLVLVLALIALSYFKNNSQIANNPVVSNGSSTNQTTNSVEQPNVKSQKIFLEISEPKNNLTVAEQAVTVTGKTIANGYVFVNEQEFRADSNGNFSTTVILDEGENDIVVVVSDDFGNSVEKDILITLESTN